jgi:cytochrome c553
VRLPKKSLLMPTLLVAAALSVDATAADDDAGARLYAQCAACHGADGAGTAEGATPRIAGQLYSVLLKQLRDFRGGRRPNFRMGELADRHHLPLEQDVAAVALYVSRMPAAGAHGVGDGSRATAGALLFRARCASCHGADGRGDGARAVPRLAGQHYGYLVRQMYDAVDGRRPTLVEVHQSKVAPLDFDQVRGIADYLSRIEPR